MSYLPLISFSYLVFSSIYPSHYHPTLGIVLGILIGFSMWLKYNQKVDYSQEYNKKLEEVKSLYDKLLLENHQKALDEIKRSEENQKKHLTNLENKVSQINFVTTAPLIRKSNG